jgi:hypothetical protein
VNVRTPHYPRGNWDRSSNDERLFMVKGNITTLLGQVGVLVFIDEH